jgi:hypothetical protein
MWYLKLWKTNWLASQKNLPFKSARASQEIISGQIMEIIDGLRRRYLKIVNNASAINEAMKKLALLPYHKDELGVLTTIDAPIVTPGQIASLKSSRKKYLIANSSFIALETILFYMVSNQLLKGFNIVLNDNTNALIALGLSVSAFMAIAAAYGFHAGLSYIFIYIKAKQYIAEGKIQQYQFDTVKFQKNVGIALVALVGIFTLLIALCRVYLLHGDGKNADTGSQLLSFALMCLTSISAIYMALAKKALEDCKPALTISKLYNSYKKKINKNIVQAKYSISRYRNLTANEQEIAWQLMLDVQTIYEQEIDARDEAKRTEFNTMLLQDGILNITPQLLQEYRSLASGEKRIVDGEFENHIELSRIARHINELEAYIAEVEAKLDAAIPVHNNVEPIINEGIPNLPQRPLLSDVATINMNGQLNHI